MRHLLVPAFLLLAGCAGPAVTEEYDRFKNMTTFSGTRFHVGSWGDEMDINLYGRFGPSMENPSTSLMIEASSRIGGHLQHDFPLILLLDGERFELETDVSTGSVSTYGSGSITEYVHAPISLAVIEKMARAARAEGKLGISEFALDKGDQERIEQFLQAVKAFPSRQGSPASTPVPTGAPAASSASPGP